MEVRKIIGFGNSSYVISLPKSWVVTNALKKGDLVYLEQKDDNILLSPKTVTKTAQLKDIEIDFDENGDLRHLRRQLSSAYILNHSTITVKGAGVGKNMQEIKNIINNLIALEIIELSSDKLVAKDYLNMEEVTIPAVLKKIDFILRAMIADLQKKYDKDHFNNIYKRDEDVNKLIFLVLKAIRFGLENPMYAKDFKMSNNELLKNYLITIYFEDIGDQLKRIAKTLVEYNVEKTAWLDLTKILANLEKQYDSVMKAVISNNIAMAFDSSNLKNPLLVMTSEFFRKYSNNEWATLIVENLRNSIRKIHDICRIAYT